MVYEKPSLLLFLILMTVFASVSIFLSCFFCLHRCVELLGEQGFCRFVLDVIQHKRWCVWLLLKLILLIHWKNSNVSINPLQLEGFHIALYVVLWKREVGLWWQNHPDRFSDEITVLLATSFAAQLTCHHLFFHCMKEESKLPYSMKLL